MRTKARTTRVEYKITDHIRCNLANKQYAAVTTCYYGTIYLKNMLIDYIGSDAHAIETIDRDTPEQARRDTEKLLLDLGLLECAVEVGV